jgi:hypothetical protein
MKQICRKPCFSIFGGSGRLLVCSFACLGLLQPLCFRSLHPAFGIFPVQLYGPFLESCGSFALRLQPASV